jgi:hypothetical protein
MNEFRFSDWIQNNWYEAGSLFIQFAFVTAAIWFARRILKTMRASQEQVGALLRLSVSDAIGERARSSPSGDFSLKAEAPAFSVLEAAESDAGRSAGVLSRTGEWLQTPMGNGGPGPLRRMIRWLQEPAGN